MDKKKLTKAILLSVLNNSDNIIVVCDKNCDVLFHNEKASKHFNFMQDNMGINSHSLESKKCANPITPIVNMLRKNKENIGVERSIEWYMIEEDEFLIITGRKDEKIINIQEKLNSVIEAIQGVCWWKDLDGVYRSCNKYAANIIGLEPSQLIGKTDYELPWAEHADKLVRHDKETIGANRRNTYEETVIGAKGNKVVLMAVKLPLKDANKNTIGTIGVSIDITEKKKLEEKLLESNKKLEVIVKKYRQFVENQEHDIRTPCSNMVGLSGLILKRGVTGEIKIFVEAMQESAQQLLDYNDEMLHAVSLVRGEDVDTLCRRFEVKLIVQQAYEINAVSAKNNNIDYILQFDEKIPRFLSGNSFYVKRILLNLISNAFRFTVEGKILVKVTCYKKIRDICYLCLIVEDTGIGISKKDQQSIFELFYKVKESNRGGESGRGIGLSLVKSYIDKMHGEFDVQSEFGKGSVFSVVLPFTVPVDQDPLTLHDHRRIKN